MSASSREEQDVKSALHASLESKKDKSYYYAHQPRGTNEAPAPPPVHEALRKEKTVVGPAVESISRYQFLDEEKYAKIYIPLEGVGQLSDDSITSEFQPQSFWIKIKSYRPNTVLHMSISPLEGDISPEHCRVRKLEHKVVVHLAKLPNAEGKCFPWSHLKK